MGWPIAVTSPSLNVPLTPEQLAAGRALPPGEIVRDITRAEIASRVAACRACPHAQTGAATCAACDLRCMHPDTGGRAILIAVAASVCPAANWPILL